MYTFPYQGLTCSRSLPHVPSVVIGRRLRGLEGQRQDARHRRDRWREPLLVPCCCSSTQPPIFGVQSSAYALHPVLVSPPLQGSVHTCDVNFLYMYRVQAAW